MFKKYMIKKKISLIHDRLVLLRSRCLEESNISERMTKEKITMIQKEPQSKHPSNYRPITCLRMIWEFLIAQIRDGIYYSDGFYVADDFQKNRKDASWEQEEQMIY